MGEDGFFVGADLVGHIAVGCNAVCAHHHHIDFTARHEGGGCYIGYYRDIDAVASQFPRRKAGALEKRPGFVRQHMNLFSSFNR